MSAMPPENEIPGHWGTSTVLLHNDTAGVSISGGLLYSSGFTMDVAIQGCHESLFDGETIRGYTSEYSEDDPGLGIRIFYDRTDKPATHPEGLMLLMSTGGATSEDARFWVSPRPEKSWSVRIVADWPAAGLDEATAILNTDVLALGNNESQIQVKRS